jgi:hypothetical protein
VAIATENKRTPRRRWQQYLETENRMRRCVSEIRRTAGRNPEKSTGWAQALCLLKQPLAPPGQESYVDAQLLCQRLYEVLAVIESPGKGDIAS